MKMIRRSRRPAIIVLAVMSALMSIAYGCMAFAEDPPSKQSPPAPETRMVVVEGVGADIESSRRDAYRMAVRHVLGALVDTKTLVETDRLITDKVVVFSAGLLRIQTSVAWPATLPDF